MQALKMLHVYGHNPYHCRKVMFLLLTGSLIALVSMFLVPEKAHWGSNKSPVLNLVNSSSNTASPGADSVHSCTPTRNVFFLKVPKTGSTTLYGILSRLAISHGLRVVTYDKRPTSIRQRHKHDMIKKIIPKFTVGKSERFNVFTDHSYFVKEDVEVILKPPISYITMLREPLSQVRSWYFFTGKGREKKDGETVFSDPLTNEEYLKGIKRFGVNDIAKRFGASTTMSTNNTSFQHFVSGLDKIFLVGLTEHYSESLILFRRRLCWELEDVLHVHLRKGKYHSQVTFDERQDEKLYQTLCTYNVLDCELYDHFKRSFWRQVQQERNDFHGEVAHFKNIIRNISEYCSTNFACAAKKGWRKQTGPLHIAQSQWNRKLEFTVTDCALMSMAEPTIANYHYYTQNMDDCYELNNSDFKKCAVKPKPDGPKTCDGLCAHAPNKTKMLDDLLNTKGACMV